MFGSLFNTARPVEAEATTPPAEPVIALPAPCCEHCRLRPAQTRDLLAATWVEASSSRIRFEDAFEAEGIRIRAEDRQAHDRLRELTSTVSRLQRQVSHLTMQAENSQWLKEPERERIAHSLRAHEHDLQIAQAQERYGLQVWQKARAARQAHEDERRAREDQLASLRISARDRYRAEQREASNLPPPDETIDRSAPPLVVSRNRHHEIVAGLRGPFALSGR